VVGLEEAKLHLAVVSFTYLYFNIRYVVEDYQMEVSMTMSISSGGKQAGMKNNQG